MFEGQSSYNNSARIQSRTQKKNRKAPSVLRFVTNYIYGLILTVISIINTLQWIVQTTNFFAN